MIIPGQPRRYYFPPIVFALSAVAANPAWANMPMAPFFAFVKVSMWWVILLALLIETVALRYLFRMEWQPAAIASFFVNGISLLCGFFLYPLAAAMGYSVLEDMIVDLFGADAVVEVSALWLGASVVDTCVELLALRMIFSLRSNFGQGVGFLLANLLSAGALVIVMVWQAHIPNVPAEEVRRIEAEYEQELFLLSDMVKALPEQVILGENPYPEWRDREWRDTKAEELFNTRAISFSIFTASPPMTIIQYGSFPIIGVEAKAELNGRRVDFGYYGERWAVGPNETETRYFGAKRRAFLYQYDVVFGGQTFKVKALLLGPEA